VATVGLKRRDLIAFDFIKQRKMAEKRKIAIMMTVHKNEEQVNRLINHLSKEFDIFVHIDKRSSLKIRETDNVFVYKKYKVYWGSFNQIMATLFLSKKAFEKGYDRYILISGQDLPIKTNEEILDFFNNNEKEYISGQKLPIASLSENGGLDRMTRYWVNHRGRGKFLINRLYDKCECRLFNILSRKRPRPIDYEFHKGTNWTNFTHKCVGKTIEYLYKNPQYIKRFKWTHCADEIFYHTIINLLEGLEVENENLRYVNWTDGPEYPKTLRIEDYEKIMRDNKKLFARKFDANIDQEIIEMIYKEIENKSEQKALTANT
jgi:hypothetical protein